MPPVHPNRDCFCCGPDNPYSFALTEVEDGGALVGTATFDHRHEGARGALHGGALLAVVDHVMGGLAIHLGRPAVTANVSVDFRAPVLLPAEARVVAWCARSEGRKLHLRADVHVGEFLVAEARGLMIQPRT